MPNKLEETLPENAELIGQHLLTNTILEKMFGVSEITLYNWRKLDDDPIPYCVLAYSPRPTIRYLEKKVLRWAERNQKVVRRPAAEVIQDEFGMKLPGKSRKAAEL